MWYTSSTKWGNIAKHGKAMLLDRYHTWVLEANIEYMVLSLAKRNARVKERRFFQARDIMTVHFDLSLVFMCLECNPSRGFFSRHSEFIAQMSAYILKRLWEITGNAQQEWNVMLPSWESGIRTNQRHLRFAYVGLNSA